MDRGNENAFFEVMRSTDIWSILKSFMYPGKFTCKEEEYLSATFAIYNGYDSLLSRELIVDTNSLVAAITMQNKKAIEYCLERLHHFPTDKDKLASIREIAIENKAIAFIATHYPQVFDEVTHANCCKLNVVLDHLSPQDLDVVASWIDKGKIKCKHVKWVFYTAYQPILDAIRKQTHSIQDYCKLFSMFRKWYGYPKMMELVCHDTVRVLENAANIKNKDIAFCLNKIKDARKLQMATHTLFQRGFLKYALDYPNNIANSSLLFYHKSITREQLSTFINNQGVIYLSFWQECVAFGKIELLELFQDPLYGGILIDQICLQGDGPMLDLFLKKGIVPSELGYFIALHQNHRIILELLEKVELNPTYSDYNVFTPYRWEHSYTKPFKFVSYSHLYTNYESCWYNNTNSITQDCIVNERYDCITWLFQHWGVPNCITLHYWTPEIRDWLLAWENTNICYAFTHRNKRMNESLFQHFQHEIVTTTMLYDMLEVGNTELFARLYHRCPNYHQILEYPLFVDKRPFILRDIKRFHGNPALLKVEA